MTCYHPLLAYRESGKVVFNKPFPYAKGFNLPCGQCIGCRLEHSRQWATRCVHEAQMHDENCFITLTYSDENLPWDGSLNKQHYQAFMKRLRWHNRHKQIRYFHCGEYGEQLDRPHYHALLFNHDFHDKELWTQKEGIKTYTSETLQKLWPLGFSTIGDVTWETAAYCSRYTLKKKTGEQAKEHYWRQINTDLEIQLEPEYTTMSLKPAIGKEWFNTYKTDCYPSDYITNKGKKFRVPRYYDKLIPESELKIYKERRKQKAWEWAHENTPKRLQAREKCTRARLAKLTRPLEG